MPSKHIGHPTKQHHGGIKSCVAKMCRRTMPGDGPYGHLWLQGR